MNIGTISDHLTAKTLFLFGLQFLLVVTVLGYASWKDSSDECIRCHGDRQRMERLNYPELYVTKEMAERESGHPNVKCHDCHLGDGRAKDADEAHRDMLRPLFISDNGAVLKRKELYRHALIPLGTDRIREMLPQTDNDGSAPLDEVRTVLWHDRNPETFNYDPSISKKTCGKSACHPEEFKQFNTTIMGTNFRQRTMRTWREPYGPQN